MQNFASPEAKFCNLFFKPQTRFPLAPAELRLKPVRVFGMVRGLKSRAGILPAHWNGLRRVISPLPRQAGSDVLRYQRPSAFIRHARARRLPSPMNLARQKTCKTLLQVKQKFVLADGLHIVRHCFGTRTDVELHVNAAGMGVHRACADAKRIGDFIEREAARQQRQHFPFARRKNARIQLVRLRTLNPNSEVER